MRFRHFKFATNLKFRKQNYNRVYEIIHKIKINLSWFHHEIAEVEVGIAGNLQFVDFSDPLFDYEFLTIIRQEGSNVG